MNWVDVIRNLAGDVAGRRSKFLIDIVLISLGVALLVFTFYNAYVFLLVAVDIPASSNLEEVFGESLAPLIHSAIRIMYLGVMGWIGSLLTARGVQILLGSKEESGE